MTTKGRAWRSIVCAMFAVAASACSTQARWVNCQGRLEPINRPTLKQQASPSPKAAEQTPR